MNGGRRRPPRVSVGGMSSFEASGAALLAHRSLLGERRERVGAGHRGQAVEAVVPVVEGLACSAKFAARASQNVATREDT